MYQQNYSGYHQPMRPPSHPHGPPLSLHIHSSPTPSQLRYPPYGMSTPTNGTAAMPMQQPPPSQTPQQQSQPPPSPSEQSERTSEEDYSTLQGPPPTSHIWNNYIWALEVVQHPQRARMCGFGDKDRRPISPPPCIRLIIMDSQTGIEVNYLDVELTHLVLTVDIWDVHGLKELNLVKQSNASPCISSAATGSFPTTSAQPPANHQQPQAYDANRIPAYGQSNGQNGYSHANQTNGTGVFNSPNGQAYQNGQSYQNGTANYANGHSGHPSPYQNGATAFRPTPYPYSDPRFSSPQNPQNGYQTQVPSSQLPPGQLPPMNVSLEQAYPPQMNPSTQLYTRNLIGSLCASAFRLKDERERIGIWFVLQDLSVRTEGWFRLKMNFFNLAQAVEKHMTELANGGTDTVPNAPTKSTAPCLASIFSNPFKVFSAKKFPGVVESTPLSKAFANQGIKIPIRKDTGGKRSKDDASDDGEASGGED